MVSLDQITIGDLFSQQLMQLPFKQGVKGKIANGMFAGALEWTCTLKKLF